MSSKRAIKKRKLREESYELDWNFLYWLYDHLKEYKKCEKWVDLEYKKYQYNGEEITQAQAIDEMIKELSIIINGINRITVIYPEEYKTRVDKILLLFSLAFYDLWW